MKSLTTEWVKKAERDYQSGLVLLEIKPINADLVGFLSQQCAEKYLKALLQELGLPIKRTHDIAELVDQLIPRYRALRGLRRGTDSLTRFAVEYRYPLMNATTRQARAAFAKATRFRQRIRRRLGLPTR